MAAPFQGSDRGLYLPATTACR